MKNKQIKNKKIFLNLYAILSLFVVISISPIGNSVIKSHGNEISNIYSHDSFDYEIANDAEVLLKEKNIWNKGKTFLFRKKLSFKISIIT